MCSEIEEITFKDFIEKNGKLFYKEIKKFKLVFNGIEYFYNSFKEASEDKKYFLSLN